MLLPATLALLALGLHAGYYPTIVEADGESKGENSSFLRAGLAADLRPRGWTPYVGTVDLDIRLGAL